MFRFLFNFSSIKFIFVFILIFSWIFSGWPQIWQNPSFPPEIQKAEAAITARSATTAFTNNGTTINITLPSDIQVGDLILVGIAHRAGTNGAIVTPTGWTQVDAQLNSGTTLGAKNFYKVAVSGDAGSSVTFNSGSSSNTKITAIAVAYGGVDPNDLIHGHAGQVNASSVNIVAPAVTATSPAVRIAFGSIAHGTAINVTAGGDWIQSGHVSTGGGQTSTRNTSAQQRFFSTTPNPPSVTMVADNAAVNIGVQIVLKEAPPDPPTVVTNAATSITSNSATLNGEITATGGQNATEHGFAFSTDSTLTTGVSTSTLGAFSGTGTFNEGKSSLEPNTTYYFRAYAINDGGTSIANNTGGGCTNGICSFTTDAANSPPNAPSQDAPTNNATGVSITPNFLMTATDPDSDNVSYKVTIYSNEACSATVSTHDQSVTGTGWAGQNASCTANPTSCYTSGTQGSFTLQSGDALDFSTEYWWKASAKDPDGAGTFTDSATCNKFTTEAVDVSVSLDINNFAYGSVPENTASTTLTLFGGAGIVATNNGNVTVDFDIYGADTANWTLSGTTGSNQYVHQFCNDTDNDCSSPPTNYTALTGTAQTLKNTIVVSGTVAFQLRIITPNPSTVFTEQSAVVTVQASAL